MVNNRILEDLLQKPLGPYHDRDILDETKCQMKGTTELVLYKFILEHDGRITGLDESEHPLEGDDDRKFRFRGVLKIATPDWLSDFGLTTIEAELNLRAKERALRLGEGSRNLPQLTLDNLFRKHLTRSSHSWQKEGEMKLAVLIQGEKNMPANFMFSSRVPNGLLWNSKAHNRNYQVATMDVETYSLSEIFFWRWRLLALMDKICKRNPWVPQKKRTPRWFVERYFERFACPSADERRRLIWNEEDSDVDEMGHTVTPRHLLKPHRSEILGALAAHAGWFITNNEAKRKQVFDISAWDKFAKKVRGERREAAENGVVWGRLVGQEEDSSEEDVASEDNPSELVKKNPVIGKSNNTLSRKIKLAHARSNRENKASYSSGSGSEEDAPGGIEYVSDFSEPSDAEEDDSDHRLAEDEAIHLIPWELQVPPVLPDVDGRWWCPLPQCNYQTDLYDLREEEERGVPRELIRHIQQKQWRNAAYDENAVKGFRWIVTNHYTKHFEEYGLRAERREEKMRFVLIDRGRRCRDGEQPVRGPMPGRGTLGGESRVVPIVHAPQAGHFQ